MTTYIKTMLAFIRSKKHHAFRQEIDFPTAERFCHEKVPPMVRVSQILCEVLEAEQPIVLPDEKILYWRTVKNTPELFTKAEWEQLHNSNNVIHELGRICNISPDYATTIQCGLLDRRNCAEQNLKQKGITAEQIQFYVCVIKEIDAVLELAERYRKAAIAAGNIQAAEVLAQVPQKGARTFREALQSFRILHFTLWCEGEYHNTLGRFDQYMMPYLQADLAEGRLTKEEAFELLEDFFLTLNRDSDLYPGIQQGDNGQSMMLGGVDHSGKQAFNILSEMCLHASRELKLIDPKINLRVNSQTPLEVYESASLLTKEGLGFPQYSNDDIVIDGLVQKGYDLKDARDYTVAACWEFIIPGVGMDIPNIAAVNFPKIINDCILEQLELCKTFEEFFTYVKQSLGNTCYKMNQEIGELYIVPAPFMSVLMDGCLKNGQDISLGSKYNNYGFHGVGISTAVDSLIALKQMVFEQNCLTIEQVKEIILNGYDQKDELFAQLRYDTPKFGDDNEAVDEIAVEVIQAFADATERLVNKRGGCIRAGTGSAMFYLWYAQNIGSTLSGHCKGEGFSANYSPELFVKNPGPLSVIRSFTKPDLKRVINGGPLTMEFHSTVFEQAENTRKVALLVKSFIDEGGHQLQLNSVNQQMLLDAQKHPEQYKNLIVRVWGWSAYFIELDKEYQDHVISRQEYII